MRTIVNTFASLIAYSLSGAIQGAEPDEYYVHRMIVRDQQTADMVYARLSSAKDIVSAFRQAARQYSVDIHSKRSGGEYGWLGQAELRDIVRDRGFEPRVGQVEFPIKLDRGWQIVMASKSRLVARNQEIKMIYDIFDRSTILDLWPPSDSGVPPGPTRIRGEVDDKGNPTVVMMTSKGRLTIELLERDCPNAVANFLTLVDNQFYDSKEGKLMRFYSRPDNLAIISGSPTNNTDGDPGYRILSDNSCSVLKHTMGTLTMLLEFDIDSGKVIPDSAGSQFMICLSDVPAWDGVYQPFGKVIDGLDLLLRLQVGDLIESVTVVRRNKRLYEVKRRARN